MNAAKSLLSIGAVFLRPDEPFTWASGIKSPIYCDNRLILSAPAERKSVENGLAELIRTHFPNCEMLMGTATAGIAHAALIADILNLPMGYVRSSAKDHGRANRIEGRMAPGAKVVVVEDLVSTGGSSIEVAQALRDAGADVLGMICIFTYDTHIAQQRLAEADLICKPLTTLDELVNVAVEEGYIKAEQKSEILAFRDNLA